MLTVEHQMDRREILDQMECLEDCSYTLQNIVDPGFYRYQKQTESNHRYKFISPTLNQVAPS